MIPQLHYNIRQRLSQNCVLAVAKLHQGGYNPFHLSHLLLPHMSQISVRLLLSCLTFILAACICLSIISISGAVILSR